MPPKLRKVRPLVITNSKLSTRLRRRPLRSSAVPGKVLKSRLRRLKRRMNRPSLGGSSTASYTGRPRLIPGPHPALTQAGMAFLKCAFAPPDFSETQVQGIPDMFRGKSLLKKHRLVTTTTFSGGTDYYILLLPIPGFSYFLGTTVAGVAPASTIVFTGVPYADYSALFPAANPADIVNSFRFVSNHFEIINQTNQMSWSGAISILKLPVKFVVRPDPSFSDRIFGITGLQSILSTNANQYNGSFFDGGYTGAYNIAPDFEFVSVPENIGNVPLSIAAYDFGQINVAGRSFTGFDNSMESILIKITGITAATAVSAMIKTWSCVEYTALDNSSIYEYQTVSPPLDEFALRLYRETAIALPIGVKFSQNADFWKRVLSIIRTLSGAGRFLPGPYGLISSGINTAANGIASLTM